LFIPRHAISQSLDFLDDDYLYEDEGRDYEEKWDYVYNGISSPFQDVPRDHWAYNAVKHLAELGLLEGYEDDLFHGDHLVSRYEMAVMVDKILRNYLYWEDTGKLVRYRKIKVREEPPKPPMDVEPYVTPVPLPERTRTPKTFPAIPTSKDRDVTVTAPAGGHVILTKKGPVGLMPIEEEDEESPLPAPGGPSSKTIPGMTQIKSEKPSPGAPVKKNEWKEKTVKVEEEVQLTTKVEDMIEELANTFKKELKDLDREFKRAIKDVEKVALKNQRQIDRLQQEDERFKITGNDEFVFEVEGNYDPPWDEGAADDYYGEQTRLYNTLELSFNSKPNPQQELYISGTTKAKTQLGTRTGYYGYIDGTNTAFSVDEFNIHYSDKQDDPRNPRNFKIRDMAAGNVSVNYSPLTMYGYKIQGLTLSLKLNDYTLNMFGGRLAYHYPIFLGQMHFHEPGNDTQYDRYAYGANVQASIFGEPKSMGNFQKIFVYDNYKTNYYGRILPQEGGVVMECEPGSWIEMQFDNDPSQSIGVDSDESYKDLFCLPPEKNSITSAFIRYPVHKSVYITAEYAHSTYYKPGYAAIQSPDYLSPSAFDRLKDELGIDDDQDLTDEYGYKKCDTDDLEQKIKGCWFESRERRDQDDGFLILFDYNKGPVQIFPIGYARLGSEFVTKYFGLPGFDINTMMAGMGGDSDGGGGLAFLPIAIQSLEAYITNFSYDRQQDQNFKYSTYYIWGNEIKPMYIDPGAVMYGLSTRKDKGSSNVLLANFVTKLNTRRETLRLNAWINDLKYYIADNMNLTLNYTRAKVRLPHSCLDGDVVTIKDEFGNVIFRDIGDGIYSCGTEGGADATVALDLRADIQSMELYWKTSKNSELTTTIGTTTIGFGIDYSVEALVGLVEDLVPRGRYWNFEQNFKYRLTDSTSLDLSYVKQYDRVEDEYSVDNYRYPVVDVHKFRFKISTSF